MDFKRRPTARQFTSNFEMTRSYRVVAGDTRESLLLINPQYTNLTAEVSVSSGGSSATYDEEFTGFGGELGYRFYTGDRGMNGLFAGIFALGGAYQAKNPFAGLQYAKASEEFLDLPLSASVIAGSGPSARNDAVSDQTCKK